MGIFNMDFDINTVLEIFTKVIIIFLVLPVHEYAHAWAAHKMGDDTAAYAGRLTLNPLAHIDWFGAVCIFLTDFGWAKPVPINPIKFKKMRLGVSITAAAGPLSNLIVAFVALIAYRFIQAADFFRDNMPEYVITENGFTKVSEILSDPLTASSMEYAINDVSPMFILLYVLEVFIIINVGLAIFNLIPIPPLDGSKILGYFTPAKFDNWLNQNAMIVNFVFMIVVVTGVLSTPLGWIGKYVREFMWFITGFIPKLMGV